MKNFPTLCVDDFYSDPQKITEFALKQNFYPSEGFWPGSRTESLHKINKEFFNSFCYKIFSMLYDIKDINWIVDTSFQIIYPFNKKKDSFKNKGWIHEDSDTVLAGVIYLTLDADLDSGTSLFKCIDPKKIEKYKLEEPWSVASRTRNKECIFVKNYKKYIEENEKNYIETVRFNNVYNRMIMYDGSIPHRCNTVWAGKNPRLTQTFFVKEVSSKQPPPLIRKNSFL